MAIESRIYVLRLLIALLLLSTEGIHIYLYTVYLKLSVASLAPRTLQTLKVRFRGGGVLFYPKNISKKTFFRAQPSKLFMIHEIGTPPTK